MYTLDINDIIFLIKSIKFPSDSFNIKDFVIFISGNTRLANNHKLQHTRSSNVLNNNRIARIWNVLPVVDCNLCIPTIKSCLLNFFLWSHFAQTFDSSNTCTFSFLYMCPCNKCNKHPKAPNFDKL